jgi:hypothetical protein
LPFKPGRKAGVAIAKGDPANSLLVRRITSTDPKYVMPPPEEHKPLEGQQIALLRQWIEEGAEYQEHWAFVRPAREPLPAVKNADVGRSPFDRFVLAGSRKPGFTGAPEADKYACCGG